MRTGTIRLRSGDWDWKADERANGKVVSFRHRTRYRDEMLTWSDEDIAAEGQIRELASHPITRTWEDRDGLVWEVSTRIPESRGGDVILSFRRKSYERRVAVAADFVLGEATHQELSALLEQTSV